MTIFQSLIKKEALHIVRDRRTMIITLVMPLVLLLLFGFAISMEINDVRVAVVVDRHTPQTREIVARMQADDYFSFTGIVSERKAEDMLRRGETDAILFLRSEDGSLTAHIDADASNPVVGQASSAYIQSLVSGNAKVPVLTSTMYNPQLRSAYNFVPGIMGIIFILICAIMTSVSIVSEKETGTMDLLSCVLLCVMLLLAYTVLGLPVSYTIVSVVVVSMLYVVLSLAIGLLVSTIVSNQVSALIVSAVLFMLPVIMLSGMIFPIDNMPTFFRWVSCVIPARWYIEAMRKLMIQQLDFQYILQEFFILLGMTVLLLVLSIKKFNAKH